MTGRFSSDLQKPACFKSDKLSAATSTTSLIDAARALSPMIQVYTEEAERLRRIPGPVIEAMMAAGLFGLCLPRELGGTESDPATVMRMVETVSKADGSAGWCLMVAAAYGALAGYLPPDVAREIYTEPCVILGGSLQPTGRAVIVQGGYRVTGSWPAESDPQHCKWLVGGCLLDGDTPRSGLSGTLVLFFPAKECSILDTWGKVGLRGTGNHEYSVDHCFVAACHALSLFQPLGSYSLNALPIVELFSALAGVVSLGIARHAMEILIELSGVKVTAGSRRELGEVTNFRESIGYAEAAIRSARAFLYESIEEAWELAKTRQIIPSDHRTTHLLAAAHATNAAKNAVNRLSGALFEAGVPSRIYSTSGLERCVRDIHAVAQHDRVQVSNYEAAGQALLGGRLHSCSVRIDLTPSARLGSWGSP